ncbi:unnamed protein product [Adineta steineri]|uniref:Protein kinase domain-containing protein n=2 Tax=Adineta steineri TaxID=433720 RepID=A0A814IMX0_9BILA|nr:unnamed protein product [Adineta steineri]CAF3546270.1 unnamed protein product [Adineta steineri]
MTNPESQYQFIPWPVKSSSNLSGIYKQNQDNCQMFNIPTRFIPMTYLQPKEQSTSTFSKDEKMKSSDIVLTGLLSSSSFEPLLSESNIKNSFHTLNTPSYSSLMLNSLSNTQSRKRKQPINDSSLFLTPTIPAKRSPTLTMFFPTMMPSNNSVMMLINNSKCIQTDSTNSFTSSHQNNLEQDELIAQINELRRSKSDIQCQYESTVETVKRCLTITRSLLIDKSQLEKKQVRKKVMENRLHLGQFLTQRQGMSFIEQWNDGYDFLEKKRAQEQLILTKKNLNKDRKILAKKKSFLQQQLMMTTTTGIDEINSNNNSNFNYHELMNSMYTPSTKLKRTNKNLTIKTLTSPQKSTSLIVTLNNGPLNTLSYHQTQLFSDNSNDSPHLFSSNDSGSSSSSSSSSFISNSSSSILTLNDWYEYDEVLRLRQLTLKREETDLIQDLEKLDRQRNLHIRELKLVYNEDHSRFNKNNILHDRYLLLTLIGKGGFSEVHRAFDLNQQCYVACKIHQLNKEWKDEKKANYIKHALREYNIHKHLEHKRIVKLFDVFEIDTNSFCTVLEYCDGNDLDFFLKQNKTIPEKEARSIIMQIVNALKYLNTEAKPSVIHYDLKPGNVLLGTGPNSGEIKITDFGLSKQMHEDIFDEDGMDLSSQGAGTYWYLPPEVFVQGPNPPKISSKVDVWSVGCIFYQCLYGRKPYGHNLSQAAILENQIILNAKEIQFPNRPLVSTEAKLFIRRCLTYKVHDRPDVLQLSEDKYLKSYSKRSTLTSSSLLFCPT